MHRCEPYVYAQMIAGKDAPTHGEAKNSWLTGTAAWNYVAITQWILGIRPELRRPARRPGHPGEVEGLHGDAPLPRNTYVIEVKNPHGKQQGVKRLVVDGEVVPGNLLPLREPRPEPIRVQAVLEG